MVRVTIIARNKTILCDLSTATRSIVMAIDIFPAMHVNIYHLTQPEALHFVSGCIACFDRCDTNSALGMSAGDMSLIFFPMPYPTPIKEDIDRVIFSP